MARIQMIVSLALAVVATAQRYREPNPQIYPSGPSEPTYPTETTPQYDITYPTETAPPYQNTHPTEPIPSYVPPPHSVKPGPNQYPCKGKPNGRKYPVKEVCFAYFTCRNGEPVYNECEDYYSFDAKSGKCVRDTSCVTACPEGWAPYPKDTYKFLLDGKVQSCAPGTYFDFRLCTCNFPVYPASYRR